jgi:hypothetical protein
LIFLKKGWVVLDLIHAVHAQVVRGIAHSQAGQDRARTGRDLVKGAYHGTCSTPTPGRSKYTRVQTRGAP